MKSEPIILMNVFKNDTITFKVTGIRKFKIRIRIAIFFIQIAAWIMPIKSHVAIEA